MSEKKYKKVKGQTVQPKNLKKMKYMHSSTDKFKNKRIGITDSEDYTNTEKQRSCKKGQVYSAKLKKCIVRKGQDPRFAKDRPKKAMSSLSNLNQPRFRNKRVKK
jgi:hypothetical protein